jgi:hypothetical protein
VLVVVVSLSFGAEYGKGTEKGGVEGGCVDVKGRKKKRDRNAL